MHQNLPFFIKKRPKMAVFLVKKLSFSASGEQLKTHPPTSRVLDAEKQVVGAHRSRKHSLQHPYVPKSAIFHEKTDKNGRFLL